MSSSAPIHWSFSSLKTFKNCPKRFYETREVRSVVDGPSEHTTYGTLLHEAAERYLLGTAPLPPEFEYITPLLDGLRSIPGTLYAERDLSLLSDYTACNAGHPHVWFKAFADVMVVQADKRRALVGDFKTGNPKYADMDQLEVYALATFSHEPDVDIVTAMLLFTKPGSEASFTQEFHRKDAKHLWLRWHAELDQLRRARERSEWPANPSGLCKFCPVTHCMSHPSWTF
jgi:hypothetical protein